MGAFGRETNTYAHQVQVLSARWEDAKATLGTAFLPVLTKVMGYLSDGIPKALANFKAGWKGIGDGSSVSNLAVSLKGLSDQLGTLTKQAGDAKQNGFVKFAIGVVNAMSSASDGLQLFGANWRIITGKIRSMNDTVAINFQKMIVRMAEAGSKLPGPMVRHFKRIADDGRRRIGELQGSLNKTNTSVAQARVEALNIKLRHLGRQRPTPKVRADIAQAQAQVNRINARLRGIKDEYVNVWVSEQRRDDAMARRYPARAAGGPVTGGKAYIVGEKRPELFVPGRSGTIIPNLNNVGGGGGGNTYVFHINGAIGSHAQLRETIVQALERAPAGGRKIPASAIGPR
jgi:hypothetical protein